KLKPSSWTRISSLSQQSTQLLRAKKFKKVNLLKNPFSDSNSTSNRSPFSTDRSGALQRNPFSDSRALLNKTPSRYIDDYDEDDGEEDEERMVQSRRDALAALDPKNKASRTAEFKSLKAHSPSPPASNAPGTVWKQNILSNTEDQRIPPSLPPLPSVPPRHERVQTFETTQEDHIALSAVHTPQQSLHRGNNGQNNYRSNTPSTPGSQKDVSVVPEIAISLATPSPKKHHRRGSSITTSSSSGSIDPSLLSSTFIPSPLSTSLSLNLQDEPAFDEWGLPIVGETKPNVNRTTALYKNFFHRITSSSVFNKQNGNGDDEELEDHIGAEIDRDPGTFVPKASVWSLKRSTFGTPMQQGNQQQRCQDSRKRKTGRRRVVDSNPWDSGDDMLIQDPDCVDDNLVPNHLGQEDQSLKGQVGGRKRSEDGSDSLVEREHVGRSKSLLNRGGDEDWMMHPRTAAIHGTFHRVRYEAVPVPNKPLRPMSLNSDYTTFSLASPPAPRQSSSSLSRGDHLTLLFTE
ncbi:hypothetical protein BGX26_001920, partial [Mortierella sp. AD094]